MRFQRSIVSAKDFEDCNPLICPIDQQLDSEVNLVARIPLEMNLRFTSTMVVVAGVYTAATAAAASASDNIRHPSRRLAEQSPSCTAASTAANPIWGSNYTAHCKNGTAEITSGTCPTQCIDVFKAADAACTGFAPETNGKLWNSASNLAGLNLFVDATSVCYGAPITAALQDHSTSCQNNVDLLLTSAVFMCGKDATCNPVCKSAIDNLHTACSSTGEIVQSSAGTDMTVASMVGAAKMQFHPDCVAYLEAHLGLGAAPTPAAPVAPAAAQVTSQGGDATTVATVVVALFGVVTVLGC